MKNVRVRFAPSPTGPLHIGGVRTALYNYLFARKNNGTFILRIEDTDQKRYVAGAEEYITASLDWLGLSLDESPELGGEFGPYRQSDRRSIYEKYTTTLIEKGAAYYAFDTPEELEEMRKAGQEAGIHSPKYDASIRMTMKNSLSLSPAEVKTLLENGTPYVVRMKIPENETIEFQDIIRGHIQFESKELDDKVILKTDGMPTYHLANIIDDFAMKISHVIRGEEWLSSTAHHVLLYRGFGWENDMPQFAHLPLILKPSGKGKLSKRDGDKLGIPVFPMSWEDNNITGFDSFGFNPDAVINFLAFLGWNPGTDQEIFNLNELVEAFSLEKIGKSGARFDFDKAKWFNQQYILKKDNSELSPIVADLFMKNGVEKDLDFILAYIALFKERVVLLNDFLTVGSYTFRDIESYDEKTIRKKWKADMMPVYKQVYDLIEHIDDFQAPAIEESIKSFMAAHELGFGQLFPVLRVGLTGTSRGADLFQTMSLIGKSNCLVRWDYALKNFSIRK